MTQKDLGEAIGMAQTWVSMLENPDYGKMTVATLLRLAEAFDTDLEIKFRPFSRILDTLPEQGPEYFSIPSFAEEFEPMELAPGDLAKVRSIEERAKGENPPSQSAAEFIPSKKSAAMAAAAFQEQYGTRQGSARQNSLAV
jgi:transcriptional regulator with XRE-family HTH domain